MFWPSEFFPAGHIFQVKLKLQMMNAIRRKYKRTKGWKFDLKILVITIRRSTASLQKTKKGAATFSNTFKA